MVIPNLTIVLIFIRGVAFILWNLQCMFSVVYGRAAGFVLLDDDLNFVLRTVAIVSLFAGLYTVFF